MSFYSGYVSIIGKTNAGKSSLINGLVGEKVAIVTPKTQTTRNNIIGIMNGEDYQVVFVDTPGIHKTRSHLDKYMMKNVRSAIDGVDLILYLIDGDKGSDEEELKYISSISEKESNVIVVITKIDKARFEKTYPLIEKIQSIKGVKDIVCLSNVTRQNYDYLMKVIKENLTEYEEKTLIYDEDLYTDKSIRFLVAEIIREKALLLLNEEVPHGIAIDIKDFKETDRLATIYVDIICERSAHKNIIIGKGGNIIKKIGEQSRQDIERLLDKKVMLNLWVRDKKNWRNNLNFLNDVGYSSEEI